MGKIFEPKRKRGQKSDWLYQFAQCIDENGIVWVDEVADYMRKTVGEVRAKVNALGEEFGEERLYRMITAASHDRYSGRTCVGFDQHETERKRKGRNKRDVDLAQLAFLADNLPDIDDSAESEETENELAVA